MTLRALGAYIFAGAFTEGVKKHFEVKTHLEGSDYGVETAKLNWPDLEVLYPEASWPTGADRRVSELDFIYANPPCAVFSSMGIATTRGQDAWRTDPRLSCWYNAFKLVEDHRPRAFALESVTNAYTKGREVVDELTARALAMGYSATHLLLDAKWTGIPQSRRRFFLVLHRQARLQGYAFNFAPPPTVGETIGPWAADPGYFTVHSRKDWPELVAATPPGERLANTWERLNPGFAERLNVHGKVAGRPSFQDRKLNASETMGAWVGDKFYHPTLNRAIGLNEAKAICGYSPEFRVAPKDLKQFGSLLARAVMPPVGAWLANAVRVTLEGPESSDPRVTLVDVREAGISPADITARYHDASGAVIAPRSARAINGGTDGHEREDGERAGGPDTEVGAAPLAAGVRDGAQPGPGEQVVQGDGAARDDRAERPAGGGAAREARAVAPVSGDLDDLYATVAEITGVGDRATVKRVALALSFSRDHARVARATGTFEGDVAAVEAAVELVAANDRKPVVPNMYSALFGADRGTRAGPASEAAARVPSGGEGSTSSAASPSIPAERAAGAPEEPARGASAPEPAPARVSVASAVTDSSTRAMNLGGTTIVPEPGEPSGKFIKRLLLTTTLSPESIRDLVLASYANRKTKVSDVYYNWNELRKEGVPDLPPWRGAAPSSAAGPPEPNAKAPAASAPSPAAGSAAPAVRTSPHRKPLAPVAVVEWFPRACGSVAWGYHLSRADDARFERVTFSSSGKPLAAWNAEHAWNAYRIADAADRLNDYDRVVLVDVACFAPEVSVKKDGTLPYYVDVLKGLRTRYTGMYHGGLYASKYDPVLDVVCSGPGFSGRLVTTRLRQAEARLATLLGQGLTLEHHPYLPYDASWSRVLDSDPMQPRTRTRSAMMTARIASNKGQNALLAIADGLACDCDVWGYNSFGLPSIGKRLVELGQALGYRLDEGTPRLRRDKRELKHPNAVNFYTGEFGFTTPSGRRFAYRDGFGSQADVDWSPLVHLSLPSRDFGDTLEYVSLDAVAAGCVAVVPRTSVTEAPYESLCLVDYEGCSLWANDGGDVRGKDFDRAKLTRDVNELVTTSEKTLLEIAIRQRTEVLPKHDPALAWAAVERALSNEGYRRGEK